MRTKLGIALALALGLLLSVSGVTSATAATQYYYFGYAGGTDIEALGTTISSQATAASTISGSKVPNSNANSVASVDAPGLVKVGAVTTDSRSAAVTGGFKVTSTAKTAGLNLLNGLITADAVTSTNTLTQSNGKLSADTDTSVLNLSIAGQKIALNPAKNTTVVIPGIAYVVVNSSMIAQDNGSIVSIGHGLYISLLKPFANAPAGATISLNPTYNATQPVPPSDVLSVGGMAYGTFVQANAGPGLKAEAARSARYDLPLAGTGGLTKSTSVASLSLPGVLNLGVVKSTGTGTAESGHSKARTTNEITGVNVLNGLVKADAISVSSQSEKTGTAPVVNQLGMKLVNLTIAGQPISVNVAPNTKINVANVGVVTINERNLQSYGAAITAVHIKLSTATLGLPVGAEIEVGVASSTIWGG